MGAVESRVSHAIDHFSFLANTKTFPDTICHNSWECVWASEVFIFPALTKLPSVAHTGEPGPVTRSRCETNGLPA